MRRGELMALTWQHVDLDAGIVSVEQSTAQLGNELVTTTPKNHEASEGAVGRAHGRRTAGMAASAGSGAAGVGECVRGQRGDRFHSRRTAAPRPQHREQGVSQAQAGLGLPSHDSTACGTATRRSCCVTACQFTSFSKRLGHKDAAVTLNVYADVIPDDDSGAVDTVIKAVWGAW